MPRATGYRFPHRRASPSCGLKPLACRLAWAYTRAVTPDPTRDRGDILHLAGRHQLSPALRGGEPALVSPADREGRCGWEPFFAALERLGLWVGEEADGSVRIGPRAPSR